MSLGNKFDEIIKTEVSNILKTKETPELMESFIATDNFGEVLEKLIILHIRTWFLEDAIGLAKTDEEVANLKRKIDICFKQKRPAFIAAINRLIEENLLLSRKLHEDSVKLYKKEN